MTSWSRLASGFSRRRRLRTGAVIRHIVLARRGANLKDCCAHVHDCGCLGVQALPLINGVLCSCTDPNTLARVLSHPGVYGVEEDLWIPLRTAVITSGLPAPARQGGPVLPWGVERIGAPRAWASTRGEGVRVAVIDTGIDLEHPDLVPNLRGGFNVLSPQLPPADDNGHGTHVAGTVAAVGNSGSVIGVAPRAELFAVKAFDSSGGAGVSDVLLALQWCADYNMHVINMSFGQDEPSEALARAIAGLERLGILLVAAAGNDGGFNSVDFPARYPEVLAVVGTNKKDRITRISSLGPEIDIAAPGQRILSLGLGGGTRVLTGTSMATPHVAGTAALIRSRWPRLSPDRVRTLIMASAEPLPAAGDARLAGLVRADRALGV